ncbi:prevent-host-death family protein [Lawsonia intracellularis]|uniref:type II toxin-antitoxin system Phd/YefM family antitoxin n=1 Tax=Lawsonia intracellularis TaxID=29546 RepID=UPI0009768EDA|nr:type II toxin-antitoxin system Phd/YefM family antitoxin [Lawsonia intracellularis]OMQ02026.1 prevent-host-death family protein [Lawsonia intracellularis]
MKLSQDIKPISYIKANSAKVLEQVNISGPMIITQNGEASAVLMGIKDYEQLKNNIVLLKVLLLRFKSADEGNLKPVKEVFKDLDKRIVDYVE